MKLSSWLQTLLLSQDRLGPTPKHSADIDSGTFQNPGSRLRPRFRYWLPDAGVDPAVVQKDIKDVGAIGGGGVEFVPIYNYGIPVPGLDWSTYGFGTPAYVELFKAALRAHKEAGLAMDFSLGPNQGQGVPASPDDEGLQWDLAYESAAMPSSGSFQGSIPGWGTGQLVALVTAEVLSSKNLTVPRGVIPLPPQPYYMQYTLKENTLREWSGSVSPTGEISLDLPPADGHENRMFAFYQYQSLHQNLPLDLSVSGTIFDKGPYVVDHFSARGAETTTKFWEEYILDDEVRRLLSEVGNYAWEDSVEATSNISWTPSLPNVFKEKYGYDIRKYLPLIMFNNNNMVIQEGSPGMIQCVLNTPDEGRGYINDFRGALLEGYRSYIQHLTEWTRSLNLQMSTQVSYNLPLDALASVPYVDAPECESLAFFDNLDGYRQFSGPAVLTGKRVISNEMGGLFPKAYQHVITDLLWEVDRAVSGGIDQVVLHGQSYTGNYYETTWPGHAPLWYLFSELYSDKQPSWDHGFSEALQYIGRVQYTQRMGKPKIDVVVYNKDSATDPLLRTVYKETDLIDSGYTYVYLSPENFVHSEAHVDRGVLAPDGPEFRAMIIPSSSEMTAEAVMDIKKFASAGLPVILAGGLPQVHYTKEGVPAGLLEEIASLGNTPNVFTIPAGQVANKLSSLGITPRVQIQTTGTWYTTWRSDDEHGVDYLYVFADGPATTGSVSLQTTKRPYYFNPWTGAEIPVLEYQQIAGRIVIPLHLERDQTVIIGFKSGESGNGHIHATKLPASVIGYQYGVDRSLTLQISSDTFSSNVLKFSNSEAEINLLTLFPATKYSLTGWNLTVERWEAPSDLSDASIIAIKRNTTYTLPSLVSWEKVPAIADASGIGYYTTTLSWPPSETSKSADGAYLLLPKTPNGARVFINGVQVPPFDYRAPKVDIGPYLRQGKNEVRVEVPSVMWNYIRTMLDDLRTGGEAPTFSQLGIIAPPGPVDNGLVGEVIVIPYVNVQVV